MPTALQSTTECCLLSATDSRDRQRWLRALRGGTHDVYHLPDYVQLDASSNGGEAAAFLFCDEGRSLLIPLVMRQIPEGTNAVASTRQANATTLYDAASPYGFPGPTLGALNDSDGATSSITAFIGNAAKSFLDLLQSLNIVSVFLRFHPLLAHQIAFAEMVISQGNAIGRVVPHGDSIYCDLALDEDEIWRQTRRRDRSYINKATRSGFRFEFDHEWAGLDRFIQMYYATMRRVDASEFYFFPKEYFLQLQERLADHVHLAFVMSPHNQPVCGAVLTTCGDIVQYHLAGTDDQFRDCHPNKFLIDQVRRWGKKLGKRWLHLGGGVGATADSLLHFKSGFSKLRSTFQSFRLVTDLAAYERLVSEMAHGAAANIRDLGGFFPAYRTPPSDQNTNAIPVSPAISAGFRGSQPASNASELVTPSRRAA